MIRFESVHLNTLARDVLNCAIGDHAITDVQTPLGAADATVAVLVGKLGRPLDAMEQALTYIAVADVWYRRRAEMRANLADTQRRLGSPWRMFA